MRRRWLTAWNGRHEPTADAVIDHPPPAGTLIEQEYVPMLLAPDPGGVAPRAGTVEFLVEALQTPVQHSPQWSWSPGTPYPGPPASVNIYVDQDSQRWWGRTGQGQLIWSDREYLSGLADLPPNVPFDLPQHIDNWQYFWGGYPSIARNRPQAFGDQIPVFNPVYDVSLPEG